MCSVYLRAIYIGNTLAIVTATTKSSGSYDHAKELCGREAMRGERQRRKGDSDNGNMPIFGWYILQINLKVGYSVSTQPCIWAAHHRNACRLDTKYSPKYARIDGTVLSVSALLSVCGNSVEQYGWWLIDRWKSDKIHGRFNLAENRKGTNTQSWSCLF